MLKQQFLNLEFENQLLDTFNFPKGFYKNCIFKNCTGLTNSNLSQYVFINCQFIDCDLSLANFRETVLTDTIFENCELIGIQFDEIKQDPITIIFKSCKLMLSSFYNLNLKNSKFQNCNLNNTDFIGATNYQIL